MNLIDPLVEEFLALLGDKAVIIDEYQRRAYECDGLAHYRVIPAVVVFPTSPDQVSSVVKICNKAGVPFVARGSGTGLSGGALPIADGVLIVTSRMRSILELDVENERAVLEPGVINTQITRSSLPLGYYYAPDPSSQQVCTIGGNVAENSGGAHCLKYGFTTHHVTGIAMVTPDGEQVALGGGKSLDAPGYDLLGAFIGSEGTLGIATEVTVRLLRSPKNVRTLLAGFTSTDAAGDAVSAIIGGGVVPAAIEMMDALAIEAAEAAVHCGYPEGAGSILLIEVDGPDIDVERTSEMVEKACLDCGAFEIRIARDDAERALFWKGRKSAFAAVGRISPDYLVQDGVIPRTSLAAVLAEIAELSRAKGLRVANVFHAGDGNLHPLVLFDSSVEGETELAEELSGEIVDLCIAHRGSITGEHGVGVDKKSYMPKMFTESDLETMHMLRHAFDPDELCNPGKVLPTPNLCGEATWRTRLGRDRISAGVSPSTVGTAHSSKE